MLFRDHHAMRWSAIALMLLASCSGETATPDDVGVDGGRDAGRDAAHDVGTDTGDAYAYDAAAPDALRIQTLGVQGFVLTYRGESIMTAPLFTRQSGVDIAIGTPIAPDRAATDEGLRGVDLTHLRAIVSGHAHYDHLLDVVHVLTTMAPGIPLYANRTARHVLAAYAPDRDASCTSAPQTELLDRSRVIALDDPLASHVDYTNCPDQLPAGASMSGSWVSVPGSHVRLMPVCTTHPAQIGTTHFAPGSIDTDQCDPPVAASQWLEGQTLSFVIDFLDDGGAPLLRIYYQDAPATRPIGEVPASILAEHAVDVAILCVGSNDAVDNQPTDILANLAPRFVVSGHWENFFLPRDQPPQPIPLLNLDNYVTRAEAAVPGAPPVPMVVDGAPWPGRHLLAMPSTDVYVPMH